MSDAERVNIYAERLQRIIRRSEAKAKAIRETSPHCDVCGGQIVTGRKRHASCNPDSLAGLTCTCPPGCTTGGTWGDGPRPCNPDCEPCSLMAGKRRR